MDRFCHLLKTGRVSIRVGTPPQWVNVFVSTASEETWVVGTGGGCTGSMSFQVSLSVCLFKQIK